MESKLNNLPEWLSLLGIQTVYVSPGSRNAPIIRILNEAGTFNLLSAYDERSAGFMALGASMATELPVALLCTSGTALLNYYPAITEAFYSQVPLLIISADRPSHLIDQWEGQCIRQTDVFKTHIGPTVNWEDNTGEDTLLYIQTMLKRGIPVHVNIPLEEPLYEKTRPEQTSLSMLQTKETDETATPPQELMNALHLADNILIVNGSSRIQYEFQGFPIPVLNDLISKKSGDSDHWNWEISFLSDMSSLPHPDLLISSGTSILSKGLRNWLRSVPHLTQWHIGTQEPMGDPYFTQPKNWKVREDVGFDLIKPELLKKSEDFMQLFKFKLQRNSPNTPESYLTFAYCLEYFISRIPSSAMVHVANSSVVRWMAWMGLKRRNLKVFSNRGTSGIDGCSSTASGFAQNTDKDVYLITGDMAFFYDINALFSGGSIPKNLKIILLNDGGGGIFHWLKGPSDFPESLPFQTTPHQRDASWVCMDAGIKYLKMNQKGQAAEAMAFLVGKGPLLLEVHVEMEANTTFFRSLI